MNLPKLSKDQIQKLALSLMGVVFLLYVYFTFFLGPLAKSRANTLVEIRDMQSKLDGSKGEIQKASKLELTAKKAAARFESMKTFYPEGAPIAWFPPRIKAFFASQVQQELGKIQIVIDDQEHTVAGSNPVAVVAYLVHQGTSFRFDRHGL